MQESFTKNVRHTEKSHVLKNVTILRWCQLHKFECKWNSWLNFSCEPRKVQHFNSLHLREIILWICAANPSAKCGYIMCGAESFMFLSLLNSHINISTNRNMQDLTCSQQYYWWFVSFGVLRLVDCSAVADICRTAGFSPSGSSTPSKGACLLLKMKAQQHLKASVNTYISTCCNAPEDF